MCKEIKAAPQRTPPTFKQKIKKTNQPGSGAGSTYTQSEFTPLFVVALNSIQMAYFIASRFFIRVDWQNKIIYYV